MTVLAEESNCSEAMLFLAGPTAVGKSSAALLLAERLNGEIISVDSMQVYRGLDIGTDKPLPADRLRVPHHLVDVADLSQAFDAAQFVVQAQNAVIEIRNRRRLPIFCGGTGLYFKAWLEGLGESPAADPRLRAQLEEIPLPELLQELAEKDPATFAKIDRQNPRRVVRAVEVIRLTGRPFSESRANWNSNSTKLAPGSLFLVLGRAPEDLRQRIHQRVEAMFARGLIEETRQLMQAGLTSNRTVMQALGYRQVVQHLNGELTREQAMQLVKTKTWQFAKRQTTWFRHQAKAEWLIWPRGATAESIAGEIASQWLRHGAA